MVGHDEGTVVADGEAAVFGLHREAAVVAIEVDVDVFARFGFDDSLGAFFGDLFGDVSARAECEACSDGCRD